MLSLRLLPPALMLLLPLAQAVAQGQEPPQDALFARIAERARTMATRPYAPPDPRAMPEALTSLDYSRFRDIRFNKDAALWRDEARFSIELFHLGFLYREPVVINEVVNGAVEQVPYEPALFDYGKNEGLEDALRPTLGFAGFRIHYPINRPGYHDEVIAFLGASYFRMVGREQSYGLSARGLAVDAALPKPEEFPRFREFWLVRPAVGAETLTFYALLDSPSVTGAYRFTLSPGEDTVLGVETQVFARADVQKLAVAPLTSMFYYGDNRVRYFDDFRPEIHDSDGLLVHTGADEWIWRPLTHDGVLQVSSLLDENPRGFGLMQRDRDFDHYLDMEARYERRPSLWVQPRGDWGKGAVQLLELPARDETEDNIAAYWVPQEPFRAGAERYFAYELRTRWADAPGQTLAAVLHTRIGWGAIPGAKEQPSRSLRQFIVDFRGGDLPAEEADAKIEAELSTSAGRIRDLTVQSLPGDYGWRVAFKLAPDTERPADMRLFLVGPNGRLTETWNYVWQPAAFAATPAAAEEKEQAAGSRSGSRSR